MLGLNPVMKILMENAKTFSDRREIDSLLESETSAVNNAMVSNLYKSAIEKAHIDFQDIPESKGDLTKYSGYKSMADTVALLKELSRKMNVKISELETISDAMNALVAHRELFEKGFRLDKEFVILQYNTLVYACVEAISVVISSYVDFVKRPDKVEFTIDKDVRSNGTITLGNLEKFNKTVKQGQFTKVLTSIINSGNEKLIGAETLVIPALILGGVTVLVPLIRELVFSFYHSRMKLSDYLNQQAALLEMNKETIKASSLSATERNAIVKKQQQHIEKLRRIADKVKVHTTMGDTKASMEIAQQNKNWTIGEVKSQAANAGGGLMLL